MISTSSQAPLVGVIVVNWNRKGDLLNCIDSIRRSSYPCLRIVVVDNASSDGSVDAVREAFPEVTLLIQDDNLGFTGGNNAALRYLLTTDCEYFFLLNNDAEIEESTITTLVEASRRYPQAAFLGPLILTRENRRVILSAGGMLEHGWMAVQRGIGETNPQQFSDPADVDYLSGCALLARREVVEKIGLLDDDYFAYFEDVDWCWRASQKGYCNRVIPSARAWHPDTRVRDEQSPLVTYYISRNSILFARKQNLGLAVLSSIVIYYLRLYVIWSIRVRWRKKTLQRKALRYVLADLLRSHAGRIDSVKEQSLCKPPMPNG